MDLTLIVPLATAALAATSAGAAKVWQSIQQGRADCLQRESALAQELREERREHWKTAMALERLLGKYERERGSGSPPAPTSTSR